MSATDNKINGRTPEEIKKGLECCILESDDTNLSDSCVACPYYSEPGACRKIFFDALTLIQQLQEDKKHLQERICNQRRQLRLLHAMYEWALSRLQKTRLNDRAHFQAWLRERGYDLKTMELPESKYQQLERERDEARNDLDAINYANTELYSAYDAMKRERDAAVEQLKDVDAVDLFCCSHCKHEELCDYKLNSCDYKLNSCEDCEKDCPCRTCNYMCNWQWRGVEEVE